MATMKPWKNSGKYRVAWVDAAGVRHRPILHKKEAQELYEQVCAQKVFERSGIAPELGARAKHFNKMTFGELAEPYKEYLLKTRASDNVSYISRLVEKWGEWRLNQITPGQVKPWILGLIQQPEEKRNAISTIKKLVAYFKRVFNYGVEMELIPRNPIMNLENARIKKEFRRVNKRTQTFSAEQFWGMVKDFPQWMHRPCVCGWCTGMRLGEVISLQWRDVNLVDRLIIRQATDDKESDVKTIGIEQDLYDVLIEIQVERGGCRAEEYVFLSSTNKMIVREYFEKAFRKHADAAGLQEYVFHTLRHSYTVRKRREGFDKSVIKAQTGHHTDHMFTWYDKVDREEIQQMAGYMQADGEVLKDDVEQLVRKARENNIPLGAVQSMVGRFWRVAV